MGPDGLDSRKPESPKARTPERLNAAGLIMRHFKFRLESVLRHRIVLEELRLQALAQVHNELAACDAELAELRSEFTETVARRPARIEPGDIARRERYLDALGVRIGRQEGIREGIA